MFTQEQRLVRRLERLLLAFFLLATLFVVVVYVAAPSIYTETLMLEPAPTDRYPLRATLFLVGIVVFIAVLMVGVVCHWRWLFWLLLVAFGCMVLEIPATILQLTGVVPHLFPVWYSLCRIGVSMIAVVIAVWMLQIYRHHGVWAMGRKAKAKTIGKPIVDQLLDHKGSGDACER
jgi:predicted MFS family arabinose efflux permease